MKGSNVFSRIVHAAASGRLTHRGGRGSIFLSSALSASVSWFSKIHASSMCACAIAFLMMRCRGGGAVKSSGCKVRTEPAMAVASKESTDPSTRHH